MPLIKKIKEPIPIYGIENENMDTEELNVNCDKIKIRKQYEAEILQSTPVYTLFINIPKNCLICQVAGLPKHFEIGLTKNDPNILKFFDREKIEFIYHLPSCNKGYGYDKTGITKKMKELSNTNIEIVSIFKKYLGENYDDEYKDRLRYDYDKDIKEWGDKKDEYIRTVLIPIIECMKKRDMIIIGKMNIISNLLISLTNIQTTYKDLLMYIMMKKKWALFIKILTTIRKENVGFGIFPRTLFELRTWFG